MKMFFFTAIITCFSFVGCMFHSYDKNLNGGYRLIAVDGKENMRIHNYEGEGVIPATVFAVGQNDRFIIAKQHPEQIRTTTNYYIISLLDQSVYGPIKSEHEFNKKKMELTVEDIDFSIVFSDLE